MLGVSDMCAGLEDSIVFSMVQKKGPGRIKGILLCAPSLTEISDRHVYIGETGDADRLLELWNGRCHLSLVIAGCEDADKYSPLAQSAAASRLNLIVCSLPLAELYNRLFQHISLYQTWKAKLEDVEVREGSLRRLLGAAVKMLDVPASLYVLSPAFRLIESNVVEQSTDRIARRLEDSGFLTDAQVRFLLESVSRQTKTVYQLEMIMDKQEHLGYLLIVRDMESRLPGSLIKALLHQIKRHMEKTDRFIPKETRHLMHLLSDLFVTMPKDEAAIHRRLHSLPYKLEPFKRLLLIAPAAAEVENRLLFQIADELRRLFPHHNIAPHDKYVVVFLSGPNYLYRPEFDEKAFEALLKKYDAYAISSVSVAFIRGLRTAYIQCREMLHLLPALDILGKKRYVCFEDVAGYYRVHLCAISAMEHYGHDKTVYLAHPAVTELMRYDKMHGTDYYQIAYAYINNDCSIIKTAEETNYHRNTIINKLEKIKSQVGINMQDKNLRREMLFAFQLIRYAERIQQSKFNLY